jgi:hypothetical protein
MQQSAIPMIGFLSAEWEISSRTRSLKATMQSSSQTSLHCFPTDQALDFSTALVFAALMAAEFLLTPGRGDVYSIDDVPRRDMGFWCEQSRLM